MRTTARTAARRRRGAGAGLALAAARTAVDADGTVQQAFGADERDGIEHAMRQIPDARGPDADEGGVSVRVGGGVAYAWTTYRVRPATFLSG